MEDVSQLTLDRLVEALIRFKVARLLEHMI